MNSYCKRLGVFDSGVGGVTVLKEILKTESFDDIVYFGDTGRVPYGSRSREIITNYARQDVRFLCECNVDKIVIACGTVSAIALDTLKNEFDIPIIGVIDTAIDAALAATQNGVIGVIGTKATISNNAYERNIKSKAPNTKIISVPCPLFVPLVECGFTEHDNTVTKMVAMQYLKPIIDSGADTLILGCTHYPMIAEIIRSCFDHINLINVGAALADKIKCDNLKNSIYSPKIKYYVSDDVEDFKNSAVVFLGKPYEFEIEKIDIQKY